MKSVLEKARRLSDTQIIEPKLLILSKVTKHSSYIVLLFYLFDF